jgi:hypothetical protein
MDPRNRSVTTPFQIRPRDPPIPLGPRSPGNVRSYTSGRGASSIPASASVRASSRALGISPLRGRKGSGNFVEGLTAHGGRR